MSDCGYGQDYGSTYGVCPLQVRFEGDGTFAAAGSVVTPPKAPKGAGGSGRLIWRHAPPPRTRPMGARVAFAGTGRLAATARLRRRAQVDFDGTGGLLSPIAHRGISDHVAWASAGAARFDAQRDEAFLSREEEEALIAVLAAAELSGAGLTA